MCVAPMQIVDPEKDMIEIEQKILYPWSFNTIWSQRKHFLLVNLIGTLGICTLARRPCNRIYSVQQGSDLLADNPINQKVKGVTQGFVIPYLILTNQDKLLMELKLSGT